MSSCAKPAAAAANTSLSAKAERPAKAQTKLPPPALLTVPKRWTSQRKRVKAMTPKGEQEKDITYYKNLLGMEFVEVPAGEFQMGSEKGESSEKPVHKVRIAKPFFMQAHEVTQREWQQVMGNNPSHFKGANRPVEKVPWNDAQESIKKLCAKEGVRLGTYRLPTEAEWEYACRAVSRTCFYSGDADSTLGRIAWYRSNSGNRTHEVGRSSRTPSASTT